MRHCAGGQREGDADNDCRGFRRARRVLSRGSDKAANDMMHKAMSKHLLKVLMPGYDPRYLPEPDNYRSCLAKFESAAV